MTPGSRAQRGATVHLVSPQAVEILKAPLAGVVIGAGITAVLAWRSGIRFRHLDRRAESRAALVGALEEAISATTAFREDLRNWQAGNWGHSETEGDSRRSVLTAQNGALNKH